MCVSSYTAGTLVSTDQLVSLCPSPLLLLSVWFVPPPGDCKHVFAAHAERHVMYRHHPVCFSLRAMAFSGRVVAGDILYNMTGCRSGWQLCRCCYFSVREGRAGALRCPDHVSDTAASGLTLEDSRLCDGLFYVTVLTDLKMYLRLVSCKAFQKSLHFDIIYMLDAHMSL